MTTSPTEQAVPTAERILDVAEGFVQTLGFNAFSYAHIAAEVGITTASLHYHFRGKAELGLALIERYSERFTAALGEIERREPDARDRLVAYAALYTDVLRARRMCLCGMLAAEYESLPTPMRDAIRAFFDANHAWLEAVMREGRAAGTLAFPGTPADAAQLLLGGLEGAMLLARPYDDIARFETAAAGLLARVTPSATPGAAAVD